MSIGTHPAILTRDPVVFDCPNCNAPQLEEFYDAGLVPAHSCLLMDSPEQAQRYPRGHLCLSYCPSCGFIGNSRYDANLQAYSANYEETQHFSACFNQFARQLAQRWVDRYELRNKRILEIGCGKGEFLALLCEQGDNTGIGVDPSCIPERLGEEANARIRFIRDYYSEQYRDLECDVILCRHTLEHIESTSQFIQMLRQTIGDRSDTIILFELPDVTRILREGAFWDLYYEHCSNFTAGSLARVFRSNCFDVTELERDYDDQYLLLAARPADSVTEPRLELEDDLAQTACDVDTFREKCPQQMESWIRRLRSLYEGGKRTVIWGSGSKCVSFCTTLKLGEEVQYVVDINPHRQGKFLPGTGHAIVSPETLRQFRPDAVVVMNPIYCNEIRDALEELGLNPEILPV